MATNIYSQLSSLSICQYILQVPLEDYILRVYPRWSKPDRGIHNNRWTNHQDLENTTETQTWSLCPSRLSAMLLLPPEWNWRQVQHSGGNPAGKNLFFVYHGPLGVGALKGAWRTVCLVQPGANVQHLTTGVMACTFLSKLHSVIIPFFSTVLHFCDSCKQRLRSWDVIKEEALILLQDHHWLTLRRYISNSWDRGAAAITFLGPAFVPERGFFSTWGLWKPLDRCCRKTSVCCASHFKEEPDTVGPLLQNHFFRLLTCSSHPGIILNVTTAWGKCYERDHRSQSHPVLRWFSFEKETLFSVRIQASAGPCESPPDWQIDGGAAEGWRLDQRVNGMPFLPWLPQISPIASESQASLASGRPAGITGPAHELLSASAQMALRR